MNIVQFTEQQQSPKFIMEIREVRLREGMKAKFEAFDWTVVEIKDGNNLELTHGLNGVRNTAKNKIQEVVGGRKDYKLDCLAAEFRNWGISWNKTDITEEEG